MFQKLICIAVFAFGISVTTTMPAQQTRQNSNHVQPSIRPLSFARNNNALFRDRNSSYWQGQDTSESQSDQAELQDDSDTENDLFYDDEQDDELDDESESTYKRPEVLAQWPTRSMSSLRIDPRPQSNQLPTDQAYRLIDRYSRDWNATASIHKRLNWQAPNLRYQPLFFEDVALERYGQVVRNDYLQTAVSLAHFFTSAALLPVHARQDPVYSCDYPLGYCRPGNCTNKIFQRPFWGRSNSQR